MKMYLSGPISGTADYMERFAKAERELKNEEVIVVNPAKIFSHLPEDTTWEQYMELSLVMLKMCDAICLLEGWESSNGANLENAEAVKLGLRRFRQVTN